MQTSSGTAMSAPKFDLLVERLGPSCQEFDSSSHHSDVSKTEVLPCPPTAKSLFCVDPTGMSLKKDLALCSAPPLLRAFNSILKTSTLERTSSHLDKPPATIKYFNVAAQPGPRRAVKRFYWKIYLS